MNSRTIKQFKRNFVAGAFTASLDIILLYVMTDILHIHYLISGTISFSLATALLYFISKRWIFDKSKLSSGHQEMVAFYFISVTGVILTAALMFFFVDIMGIWYMASKIAVALIIFLINFWMKKRFVFE